MKIQGKIKMIGETSVVSEKFKKRDFVLTTSDQYPQDILFQLTQDKVTLIDLYKVGDEVEVDFNLKGREWINPQGEAKYFNTIEAWKVFKAGGQQASDKF